MCVGKSDSFRGADPIVKMINKKNKRGFPDDRDQLNISLLNTEKKYNRNIIQLFSESIYIWHMV